MSHVAQNQQDTPSAAPRLTVRPPVDIFEDKDDIVIVADLPGVPKEGLTLDVEDGRLTLFGARERFDYKRAFTLPDGIDLDRIDAILDAGILTLTLPRHERVKPRRIEIKA